MVFRSLQPLRFLGIGEKTALDQYRRSGDALGEIDAVGDPDGSLPLLWVRRPVQSLLHSGSQSIRPLDPVVKRLGPMDTGCGWQTILMNADENGPLLGIHQGHPVFEVGGLLLPQGLTAGGINGDILLPCHDAVLPAEAQDIPEPQGDGQVHAALHGAVRCHRAAILPAVARIDDIDRLRAGKPGRLRRRRTSEIRQRRQCQPQQEPDTNAPPQQRPSPDHQPHTPSPPEKAMQEGLSPMRKTRRIRKRESRRISILAAPVGRDIFLLYRPFPGIARGWNLFPPLPHKLR